MKTWIRWLMIGALGLGLWACNLADPKSDTLTLRLADSLKASSKKYDKLRIERILVNAQDTVFRQVIFEGPYENPDQLKNIALEGPSSKNFILVLHGYRNDAEVLEIRLKFVDGRPGTPEVTKLIPISPAPGKPLVTGRTPVNIKTPTWTWASGGRGGIGEYRISVDRPDMAGAMLTQELTYTAPTDLNEATHTLFVQEKDAAGNWSASGQRAIRIDVSAPKAPIVVSSQGALTNIPKPTWTWSSGGDGDIGIFRFSMAPVFTATDTATKKTTFTPTANLADGPHTLYVQEQDSAGNWSTTGLFMLIVDRTGPGTPVFERLPLSPLNSLQPTWIWKSGGGGMGTYRCKLDDTLWNGAVFTTGTQYVPTQKLSEAAHVLYVQEKNSAGNWSATASKELVLALRGPIGGPGFSPGPVYGLSLKLSPAGVPFVAFNDIEVDEHVTIMRLSGTAWETIGGRGIIWTGRGNFSFALNGSGVPYIGFEDVPRSGRATVMRFTGTIWDSVGSRGFSKNSIIYPSLAFNSNGVPYMAFGFAGPVSEASVMWFNDTDWVDVGRAGLSSAFNHSLAINSMEVPYFAFDDIGNSHKATVMRFNGASWVPVGRQGFSAWRISKITLLFSNTGTPYVAFEQYVNDTKPQVVVMRFNGSEWEDVGSAAFSGRDTRFPSLALSSAGVPYIAFLDGDVDEKVSVMRFNGQIWESLGSAGMSTGVSSRISLALNKLGVPFVAFQDAANETRVTVMKVSFDP